MLENFFKILFSCNGWISGSYVRDRIIRKDYDSKIGDIDITIPFEYFKDFYEKIHEHYKIYEEDLEIHEETEFALYTFRIDIYYFDVSSTKDYSYYTYPDVDVNTLCWDGEYVTSWFSFEDEEGNFYRNNENDIFKYTLRDIYNRCKNKECIAMICEWPNNNDKTILKLIKRVNVLKNKGWKILNEKDVNKKIRNLKRKGWEIP